MIKMHKIFRYTREFFSGKSYLLPSLYGRGWGVGLLLFLCTNLYAQDESDDVADDEVEGLRIPKRTIIADRNTMIQVSGTVIDDATKLPVAGVRVQALADNRYTAMTDAKGAFTVSVPDFCTALYVSAPSYMAVQVPCKKSNLKIRLVSNKFGKMYRDGTDYTALADVQRDNFQSSDINVQLGTTADVRSVTRSGVLDGGSAMFIRGLSSINANAQPLVFIDGVETDLQLFRETLHIGRAFNALASLSPENIEKVTVLKNATALYGARGANGVILIETKRGHSMATRIDVGLSAGVTLTPRTQKVMNASQYRDYATEMLGTMPELKKSEYRDVIFNFLNDDPNSYYYRMYHNDTDWKDEVYRTALTQNYDINVQGGDDIGMYNLYVGYADAQGTVKETGFNRLNVRFNTDINILWNLSTRFDMSFARTNNNVFDDGFAQNMSTSTVTSPAALALIKSPLVTPYQYNKHVGGFTSLLSDYDQLFSALSNRQYGNDYAYSLANPTAIIENGNGDNKNKVENTYFNVHITPKYTFNRHLSAVTEFSYTLNRNSQRYYRPSEGVPPFEVTGLGTVYNLTSSLFAKQTNVLSNTHVDWKMGDGCWQLAATGGFRYNYFSYDGSDASTQYKTAQTDKNPYLTADPASGYANVDGTNDVWKNMQCYASADYSYRNRYFATLSLLAEANSRFGDEASGALKVFGSQWAVFPSVQMGWVMTNEDWFPKEVGIDYLRLNAGFDISGNDDIPGNAARTSFTSVRYNYEAIGAQMTTIGNERIKWETTTKWNGGLLLNMLNNRLSVNLNYYIHKTRNLLTLKSFSSPISGVNKYWTNGGELENKGFELTMTGKPLVMRDWTLELGVLVGHYDNKVTALPDGNYTNSVYGDNNILVSVGNPVALFYGYKTNGIFSSDAEARSASTQGYLVMKNAANQDVRFGAGDVRFVDLNGDGVISEADKTVIGNPNPDIYGNIFATLTWKAITLDLGFNFCLGNDVYNYQRSILNSGSTFYNQQVAELGHWRYEGQKATLPRLAYGDPMQNNRFSDRWIEDGSFLRMKYARVNYQLPMPESWQSWLQGISVWAEARNLFTLTHYTGNDPEFSIGNSVMYQGIDCGNVGQGRAFLLGVKINL
jgi:TonB-linked SusC/RagA family outer membrane protein